MHGHYWMSRVVTAEDPASQFWQDEPVLAGAGKSLCYQVPALVQEGTTLVVSPLVALMRDQLSHLPPQLPAAMLWRGQTKAQAMQVLSDLRVSPPLAHLAPHQPT